MTEVRPSAGRGEHGQAANEYLMIAGLMTAVLILVISIVHTTLVQWVVGPLVRHMTVYLTSN